MSDREPENLELSQAESLGEDGNVDIVKLPKRRSGSALLYTSPLVIIVMAVVAALAWLSSAGIDMVWALGTSGWVAPPGAVLLGHDIGGKSFDEINDTLEQISDDFSMISVWLVESSVMESVVRSEFTLSTFTDEIVLSVAPDKFGLLLDTNAMRREIASLNETAEDPWKFIDRIKLWQEPPSIDARVSIDENLVLDFLESVKSTVDCEPIDARLILEEHLISPAHDGIYLDIEASIQNIPTHLLEIAEIPVTLVVNRVSPDISDDAFSDIDIANPLATYTTRFATWKRNRSRNIAMAAEHFNGIVIQPGEVLSFDDTTGPRTYAEGYLAAPMYVRGRVEMEPAGGACQVSTTLFNSALLAGLEIVTRYPHSRPCSYVPYGRDATVAYDSVVDLVFRNTLAHPIILHSIVDYTDAGTITFEIIGHPDDRVNIAITNAYSWLGRIEPTYVIDETLEFGEEVVDDAGTNGIYQRAWRTWYDDEGNEIRTEQFSNDRIRSISALIRHNGTGVEGNLDEWLDSGSDRHPVNKPPPSSGSPSNPPPDDDPPEEPDPSEPPPGLF